jgi:CRISPR/Cas system-associated endonuclease Cas1
VVLRRAQYVAQNDPDFPLPLAQQLVARRIHDAKALLQRRQRKGQSRLNEIIRDPSGCEARADRTHTLNSPRGMKRSTAVRYLCGCKPLFNDK